MAKRRDVVNDFEAWAEVSAMLVGKSDQRSLRILRDLEIAEVWDKADAAWSKALAAELVDMRLGRVERYAEICARALAHHGDPDEDSDGAVDPDGRAPTRRLRRGDVESALAEAGEAATRRLVRDDD